jgi:UDP-glucose 4-epimerase
MTSILVTGGAGYVGSVSVDALLGAGHGVVVLDDLTTGHRGAVPPEAALVVGDYGDRGLIDRVLAEHAVEAILHCGARSLVGESIQDPGRYYRDNVAGGVALLDAARAAGVQRLVFSSTAAVYGIPGTTPITEDAPLRPINPYGETKRAFEGALGWYGRAYGLRSVSLRYFNVAGATDRLGEDHEPETHLIPAVLGAVEQGRPATLFGDDYPTPDGTCIRDYIHVGDLAEAHLLALDATAPDDPRTDDGAVACNLGNGDGFSVRQVLAAAEIVIGRPIPVTVAPRRAGDPPVLVASAERAAAVLDWQPAHPDLVNMVASAWAWRQEHPGGYED